MNSHPASASQNAGWWVAVCNSFSDKKSVSFCSLKKSHFAHRPTEVVLMVALYGKKEYNNVVLKIIYLYVHA